jgi:hypothetical protein
VVLVAVRVVNVSFIGSGPRDRSGQLERHAWPMPAAAIIRRVFVTAGHLSTPMRREAAHGEATVRALRAHCCIGSRADSLAIDAGRAPVPTPERRPAWRDSDAS